MKLLIPLIGKTKAIYLDAGIEDYAGRLCHFVPVSLPVLRPRYNKKDADAAIKLAEAEQLLEAAQGTSILVALDPHGILPTSEELAAQCTSWEEQGAGQVCFLIGGHLGLHDKILQQAHFTLSLSPLTFTHEMTRLILLEQLYRAWTIKAGHNYHK